MRSSPRVVLLALAVMLGSASAARAQQLIGTFGWQLAPYCNRVSLAVVQQGSVFSLSGFDDQCGAATQASIVGTAFPNSNGTIGLGMSIVATPGGSPTHVDATVDLASLSGTWRDSAGSTGTFAFNGPGGGSPRPVSARSGPLEIRAVEFTLPELQIVGQGLTPNILSIRTGGTPAAPAATLNGDQLLLLDGGGHDGVGVTARRAGLTMVARENWAAGANGTALQLWTTANGTTLVSPRLTVDHDGNVGIGTTVPSERLHVTGDVRIGSCVYETDGGISCVSDARFKRDISPFAPALAAVARLQPVHYYWRADEFRQQAFGPEQASGLIAQDVEQVLPELVTTDEEGYKAVHYGKLPLLAIQAIKELKEKNDTLERRLADLEAVISGLKTPNR